MKIVRFVAIAVVACATTAIANEPSKARSVTFLPFGKAVHATILERPGGVREYTFVSKVDPEFAFLLVKEREQGATVYTEARKGGGFTIRAIPTK